MAAVEWLALNLPCDKASFYFGEGGLRICGAAALPEAPAEHQQQQRVQCLAAVLLWGAPVRRGGVGATDSAVEWRTACDAVPLHMQIEVLGTALLSGPCWWCSSSTLRGIGCVACGAHWSPPGGTTLQN